MSVPEANGDSANAASPPRVAAVDVLRGLSVAGMLLVNNPGSWGAIYPPLAHAEWHGWTPTDLIFPFFLFTVGLAVALRRTRASSASILRRGALILLFGLALNAFPFYTSGPLAGLDDPSPLQRITDRFEHLRFTGVLQRIALVYVAVALLARSLSQRAIVVCGALLLIGYWGVMTLLPVPDSGIPGALLLDEPSRTLAAWSDRLILGEQHIYKAARTWDPEGPLSTLPSIVTALLGVLAGRLITGRAELSRKMVDLFAAGVLLALAGHLWSYVFPINKNLWTSSYVLFTGGMACLALATCTWLIDIRGKGSWLRPFEVFGTNALLAFVGSGVMARLTDSMIRVDTAAGRRPLHTAIYRSLAGGGVDPRLASLSYALLFVLVWLLILTPLHRRRIFLRV